jgi:hypothetical protein
MEEAMKNPLKIRRTYYLFHHGGTRFRICFRGGKMELSANRRPVPEDNLREFVDWMLECVDEVRAEAGLRKR